MNKKVLEKNLDGRKVSLTQLPPYPATKKSYKNNPNSSYNKMQPKNSKHNQSKQTINKIEHH